MLKTAKISECGRYRYNLTREWDRDPQGSILDQFDPGSRCVFIGLNPSTADDKIDDPTIRRCIGFAKLWGYGGMIMLNLFALRSTDPKALLDADNPVGDDNRAVLFETTKRYAGSVVVCWGANRALAEFDDWDVTALREYIDGRPECFGVTKEGYPKHPLYVPAHTNLVPYRCRSAISMPSS